MTTTQTTASRCITFLGNTNKGRDEHIFGTLRKILTSELTRSVGKGEANEERYQILLKIQQDLSDSTASNIIQGTGNKRFNLSHQELNWMERHKVSKWLEYVIYRYRFKIFPSEYRSTDFPLHLLIEPTSICNLRCVMCFQSDNTFTKKEFMGMMPWELFTKLVDQARENGCKAITLSSRGEPTLHKQFCEMLRYISEAGIMDIKINTNATRLTEKICHGILSAGVNEVVFSVDAATKETYEKMRPKGDFEKVIANIKRFQRIRATSYPDSPTVTRISGVHMLDSQDLEKIYGFWSQFVDQVVIKKLIHRWDTYDNPIIKVENPCNLLWERMYVWYDGTVNPCDADYKSYLAVGNAHVSSLREIWTNKTYAGMRKEHLEGKRIKCPCDRCVVS